jgi:hypothetical protein
VRLSLQRFLGELAAAGWEHHIVVIVCRLMGLDSWRWCCVGWGGVGLGGAALLGGQHPLWGVGVDGLGVPPA